MIPPFSLGSVICHGGFTLLLHVALMLEAGQSQWQVPPGSSRSSSGAPTGQLGHVPISEPFADTTWTWREGIVPAKPPGWRMEEAVPQKQLDGGSWLRPLRPCPPSLGTLITTEGIWRQETEIFLSMATWSTPGLCRAGWKCQGLKPQSLPQPRAKWV